MRSACHAGHHHDQTLVGGELVARGQRTGQSGRARGADVEAGLLRQSVSGEYLGFGGDDRSPAAGLHRTHVGDPVVGLVIEDAVGDGVRVGPRLHHLRPLALGLRERSEALPRCRQRRASLRLHRVEALLADVDARGARPALGLAIGAGAEQVVEAIQGLLVRRQLTADAAQALKDRGAKKVIAAATHPVCSGPAVKRIAESCLEEVIVSDTIPLGAEAKAIGKFTQLSVARLLGEAIKRIHNSDSVSSLFV